MADTQRTRAQLLALFADNVTGQISAQDLRDFQVTMMESEFTNPGDFWALPDAKYITTDKSAKGWKLYSQVAGSDFSFMNIVYRDQSTGYWQRADVADSTKNGMVGLAMDSYASSLTTCVILLKGIVYDSSFSTIFSRRVGRPVYLASGAPGSITTAVTTSVLIVGWVMHSDLHGYSAIGKWFFNPNWAIVGA